MRAPKPLSRYGPDEFVVVLDSCLPQYMGQVATVRRFEGLDAYVTLADGRKAILFQGEWRKATEKERLEFILNRETTERTKRASAPVASSSSTSDEPSAAARPPDTYDVVQEALQRIVAPAELDLRTLTDLHASLRTLLSAREAVDFEIRRVQAALARRG